MAATVYGSYTSTTGASNFIRPYITYTVTTNDTTVTVSWTGGVNIKAHYTTNAQITCSSTCTGQTNQSKTVDDKGWGGGNHQMLSGSYSWSRTTSKSEKTLAVTIKAYGKSASTKSITISVPALQSYTISYNLNGGTGTITNQTKYYGKSIILSNGAGLTKENYTLSGWSTDSTKTTADFSLSDTYSGNSSLDLYAIWNINYVKPVIISAHAYRVDSKDSDVETDDGEWIHVNVVLTHGYLGDQTYDTSCAISVNGVELYRGTVTGSAFEKNFGEYSANQVHKVEVKLIENGTEVIKELTIASAIFPIDIAADGQSMGVMHVAVAGQPLTTGPMTIDGGLIAAKDITSQQNILAAGVVRGSDPFVVAFKKSSNGIWYAREWSNGILECWSRNNSISGPSSWSSFGSGVYVGERNFNIDFATYEELYYHTALAAGSAGAGYTGVLNTVISNSNPTNISVRLIRNSSDTSSYTISVRLYLIGKGKVDDGYGWITIGNVSQTISTPSTEGGSSLTDEELEAITSGYLSLAAFDDYKTYASQTYLTESDLEKYVLKSDLLSESGLLSSGRVKLISEINPTDQCEEGVIYVDASNADYPKFYVGDGKAYIVDLPEWNVGDLTDVLNALKENSVTAKIDPDNSDTLILPYAYNN